jgi:hypothetical protein
MSNLIDKQALISRFEEQKEKAESLSDALYLDGVIAVIDTQPTAYDIERAIYHMEEECKIWKMEPRCGQTTDL